MNYSSNSDRTEIQAWVGVPLVTSAMYMTCVFGIVVSYNRSKPDNRRTVMDKLVESFCFVLLVRIWVGHTIWVLRASLGPLPYPFALLKVSIDRITMFGGLSLSVVMAIIRYLHYECFERIEVGRLKAKNCFPTTISQAIEWL